MTPRRSQKISVPKTKSSDYAKVAHNFYLGAELAKTFEYWNAAALLVVHAAIAYTDAVTIKVGGIKSRGEDHMAAADLLEETVVLDERGKKAIKHLVHIIEQKNLASYGGESYQKEDVEKLWKTLDRYRGWVLSLLE